MRQSVSIRCTPFCIIWMHIIRMRIHCHEMNDKTQLQSYYYNVTRMIESKYLISTSRVRILSFCFIVHFMTMYVDVYYARSMLITFIYRSRPSAHVFIYLTVHVRRFHSIVGPPGIACVLATRMWSSFIPHLLRWMNGSGTPVKCSPHAISYPSSKLTLTIIEY